MHTQPNWFEQYDYDSISNMNGTENEMNEEKKIKYRMDEMRFNIFFGVLAFQFQCESFKLMVQHNADFNDTQHI